MLRDRFPVRARNSHTCLLCVHGENTEDRLSQPRSSTQHCAVTYSHPAPQNSPVSAPLTSICPSAPALATTNALLVSVFDFSRLHIRCLFFAARLALLNVMPSKTAHAALANGRTFLFRPLFFNQVPTSRDYGLFPCLGFRTNAAKHSGIYQRVYPIPGGDPTWSRCVVL